MRRTIAGVEARIIMILHSQAIFPVTQLIRDLRLGGETFYRHKEFLISARLVKQIRVKYSKVRIVHLELTDRGTEVAILLEKIADLLEPMQAATRSEHELEIADSVIRDQFKIYQPKLHQNYAKEIKEKNLFSDGSTSFSGIVSSSDKSSVK